MKKLIIGLVALTSVSAFSVETFKSMPKGSLRNGTVANGSYEFHKVVYNERDGFQPRANKKVIVSISGIKQARDTRYTQNIGQTGSENQGRATDIDTRLSVRISDGKDTYGCLLSSKSLDDGMGDVIGFNDAELGCRLGSGNNMTIISLRDYSEYRVAGTKIFYELSVQSNSSEYFDAHIEAK